MYQSNSRKIILSKLFQAMIRENIIKKESISISKEKSGYIEVKISDSQVLFGSIRPFYSFDRFELITYLLLRSNNVITQIEHPVDLLNIFKVNLVGNNEESKESFYKFCDEMKNCVSNLTLSEISYKFLKYKFLKKLNEYQILNSIDWVKKQKELDPQFSPLSFYEQSVVQGHPMHPGAKTRIGLEVEDLVAYSPEWRSVVALSLVAVKISLCQVTLVEGSSVSEILLTEYPDFSEKIKLEFEQMELNFSDYDLIPVHPWQLKNVLSILLKEQIEEKKVIPLKSVFISARALVSFRSFAPESSHLHKRHHIKTALNLLTTSDIRIIPPRATQSGPLISKILFSIQKQLKGHQEGHFKIQAETAGIYYKENSEKYSPSEKEKFGQNLSCLLRENPELGLKNDQICMPAVALLEKSPVNNKTILCEIVEDFAASKKILNLENAAKIFFRKYISICIPSIITLMSKYGISLEAHMQNTTPVFFNGEPIAMFVRDFADIRISQERLNAQGFSLILAQQNSLIFCHNISDLHKNIFYSFFQNHIGELIIALHKDFSISEKELWIKVKEVCQNIFSELKQDHNIRKQVEEDEEKLFLPTIQLKAMTKMRLKDEISQSYFEEIRNPLF